MKSERICKNGSAFIGRLVRTRPRGFAAWQPGSKNAVESGQEPHAPPVRPPPRATRLLRRRPDSEVRVLAGASPRTAPRKPVTPRKPLTPKPARREESAPGGTSPVTTARSDAQRPKPKPNAATSEDLEWAKFLEEFSPEPEEDTPSGCNRCDGRGYLIRFVRCPDCDGAGYIWNADDSRSECRRCKGSCCVRARGRRCPDCEARAVALEDPGA
jgi:hypothetical protein